MKSIPLWMLRSGHDVFRHDPAAIILSQENKDVLDEYPQKLWQCYQRRDCFLEKRAFIGGRARKTKNAKINLVFSIAQEEEISFTQKQNLNR